MAEAKVQNSSNETDTPSYYDYDYGDNYVYEGFEFEKPLYLYGWVSLAGLTTVTNAVVLCVLLRRTMHSCTNIVLVAIAIAESLAIIVTLPTFVYLSQQYEAPTDPSFHAAFILSKNWCRAFMLSKFFLFRTFHTASIWLHCLLGFQRLFSVWLPLHIHVYVTKRRTIIAVILIFLLAPFVHIYHVFTYNDKAELGFCWWTLEKSCEQGCAYLWYSLVLVHLLPCLMVTVFTALLIYKLFKPSDQMAQSQSSTIHETAERRSADRRAVTKVVIAITIALLIPEIPYSVFLTYNAVLKHLGKKALPLLTNRALVSVYEVLLGISYCANFWIYTILNKTFRNELLTLFKTPCVPGKLRNRLSSLSRSGMTSMTSSNDQMSRKHEFSSLSGTRTAYNNRCSGYSNWSQESM